MPGLFNNSFGTQGLLLRRSPSFEPIPLFFGEMSPILGTNATLPDSPPPKYSSFTSWQLAVQRLITLDLCEDEFFLKAPDVDSAANGLMEFVVSHYTNQVMSVARRAELNVKIPGHSTLTGLFTNNIVFYVYAPLLCPYLI
jgi:hypothetical protein